MSKKHHAPAEVNDAPDALSPNQRTEMVVRRLVEGNPDLVSYDPNEPTQRALHYTAQLDPGVPAAHRDGYRCTVAEWAVTPVEVTDEATGESSVLPSLWILGTDGSSVRLTGYPAINSWSRLLYVVGIENIRDKLSIVVKRRPSGAAGRSYWIVLPEVSHG